MSIPYTVESNIAYLPQKRVKEALKLEDSHASISLSKTNTGSWRLQMEFESGRLEVNMSAEEFSNLVGNMYFKIPVRLLGLAKYAGLKTKTLHFDLNDTSPEVIKEDAPGKIRYDDEKLDLNKFPKLRNFVLKVAEENKMRAVSVSITRNNKQQTFITLNEFL